MGLKRDFISLDDGIRKTHQDNLDLALPPNVRDILSEFDGELLNVSANKSRRGLVRYKCPEGLSLFNRMQLLNEVRTGLLNHKKVLIKDIHNEGLVITTTVLTERDVSGNRGEIVTE